MADRKPLKILPDSASGTGGGDSTGIGEFVGADTLGVVDGGTGVGTLAANGILLGNGTSAIAASAAMTTNGTLLIGGTGGPEVATLTAGSNITLTNGDGAITIAAAAGGIASVAADTTPQLGGSLDVNGQSIVTASNGNVQITPNGTGSVLVGVNGTGHDLIAYGDTAGNNLHWDQSADTLYINAADANYSQLKFGATSEANYGIIRADYDDSLMEIGINKSGGKLGFYTNTFTQAMLIDNAGNVGINNAAPAGKLHIEQSTDAEVGLRIEQNDSTASNPNVAPMWIQGTNAAGTNTYFAMGNAGIYTGGISYVGRTVKPAEMSIGVVVDQGANDDDALQFKSSDVAHGMESNPVDTDTYASFKKTNANEGGLTINTWGEGSSANFVLAGACGSDSTDTTSSTASVQLVGYYNNPAGVRDGMGVDHNAVAFNNAGTCRVLIKGDGDIHASDTSWATSLDDMPDALAGRAYTTEMADRQGEGLFGGMKVNAPELVKRMEDAGIVTHAELEGEGSIPGHRFLSVQKGIKFSWDMGFQNFSFLAEIAKVLSPEQRDALPAQMQQAFAQLEENKMELN